MKTNLMVFVLFSVLLASCGTDDGLKTAQEKNIAIVKKMYEHFNAHEWEKMAAMYSDTAEFKDPSLGPGIVPQTRSETARKYAEYHTMSPDIRDEIVQIYPSGDKHVIVEFVSSGTAPNGERWSLPICTIFTIENGLIVKDFTYYDNR